MDISNLNQATDPFAKQVEDQGSGNIHIRVQQRNGRKCLTTIQGLADDLDAKLIAKALKKTFKCNGNVKNEGDLGEVIQLTGDQRANVRDFFIDQEICHGDQVVLHGG